MQFNIEAYKAEEGPSGLVVAKPQLVMTGEFEGEVYDAQGGFLRRFRWRNGITIPALNDMLGTYFQAFAQHTAWYMGLIDNTNFSALSGSDTMAAHGGWQENISYNGGARPQWIQNAPSGGSVTTQNILQFTINANANIRGAFIASSSPLNSTAGILWSTGQLSSVQSLIGGQVLKINYTLTIAPTN